MTDDGDADLRDRFARAKEADRAQVPPFAAVLARSRPAPPRARLAIAVAMTAAIVLAGFIARDHIRRPVEHARLAAPTHWRSPTDFLLDVPGGELLRATPTFGSCFIAVNCHWKHDASSSDAAPSRG